MVLLEGFEDNPHSDRRDLLTREGHLEIGVILDDLLYDGLEVTFLNVKKTLRSLQALSPLAPS